MAQSRILVVEDDKHISKLIKYNLEKAGFRCSVTITGEDALALLETENFDLVLLDIMLPKMDGLEVCRIIKQRESLSGMPVVILTAKGEEVDRIVGFELGADDYVVKPFSPRELILRIKAILKRGRKPGKEETKQIIDAGILRIDTSRHKVFVNKKECELTPMEFKLLLTLMQRQGRVQSREKLLDDVWQIEADVTTRTIDTHVKRLRQKLDRAGRMIETVRGIGYRFAEEEG